MLSRLADFSGRLPFYCLADSHEGGIGFMQVSDCSDGLIGSEHQVLEKKRGQTASAFVSGRRCVRALQKQLNLSEFELPQGDFGPIWPSGLRGSISHSEELVAATILRNVMGVGIDVEKRERLKFGAARRIATQEEHARYSKIPDFDWTLVFSAKESVFKAISPIGRSFIGFREVELFIEPVSQSFSVSYSGNNIDKTVFEKSRGYWRVFADHFLTIVTIT